MGYTLNLIEAFTDCEEIDVSALSASGRTLEHRKIEIIAAPDDANLIIQMADRPGTDIALTLLNVGGASLIGKFTLIKAGATNSVTRVRVWK